MRQALQKTQTIQREVQLLRSFVIGMAGRDGEGAYRSEFVKHILSAANEKQIHQFSNIKSFLKHLRSTKFQ